jgi:hypothetical protein
MKWPLFRKLAQKNHLELEHMPSHRITEEGSASERASRYLARCLRDRGAGLQPHGRIRLDRDLRRRA